MSNEISDVVSEVTAIKEQQLRKEFAESLNRATSKDAIVIMYNQTLGGQEERRTVIGFPYEIMGDMLVIGPYFKSIGSMPRDYHQRQIRIPLRMILNFDRIQL